MADQPTDDGFGEKPFPTAAASDPKNEPEPTPEVAAEIAAIRKEGLTGRQLRMARRVAQKYKMAPTSDFDAVRLLRAKGIDPFQRAAMLELVVPEGEPAAKQDSVQLPQTVKTAQVPSTEVMSEDNRAREIMRIQRDIARRRRRKSLLLMTRLAFFVFLPTIIAGFYYFAIATPMYATKSEFVIQKADGQSASLGGMFSGTSLATSQDSIAVQGYLESRDAMLRLDRDIGLRSHFSQPGIDAIQRVETDDSNEALYKLYKKNVKIGYDPSEGIVKMEVIAADPQVSAQYSAALIDYAEEQVDQMTQRLREDQMSGARETFEDSEQKMLDAQGRVVELQQKLGVVDPVSEQSAVMSQINNFEIQAQEKRLQLQQLLDNARPNQARVDGVKGDVRRLEAIVAELRSQLTEDSGSTNSLARVTAELRIAEADLQTRQFMMQKSLEQLETARIEANRQTRYLSLSVVPVPPDEPTYPRSFENTMVAFLIFAGIYLMASLTASILREQVSS